MKVNLFYGEKRSPIPGAPADENLLTNEREVLHCVDHEEAVDYMLRFSNYRSAWRVEMAETPLPPLWPGYRVLRLPNQSLMNMAFVRMAIDELWPSESWNPNPCAYPGGTVCHYEPGGAE